MRFNRLLCENYSTVTSRRAVNLGMARGSAMR